MLRFLKLPKIGVVFTLVVLLLTFPAFATENIDGSIDWEEGNINVTGYGAPPEGVSRVQAKLLALRAAKADAYRNALEIIEGIRVFSETEVKDFITTNDEIYTKVQGFIQGGVFTDIQFDIEGICQVTLQLPLNGRKGLNNLVREVFIESIPYTPVKIIESTDISISEKKDDKRYTGIIIDTRGYGVKPALYPQIFDSDGYLLYGPTLVDIDQLNYKSIVAYSRSMEKALSMERVGDNPLIVTVTGTIESARGGATDIILDVKTAEIFRRLQKNSEIIKKGAIVFVID